MRELLGPADSLTEFVYLERSAAMADGEGGMVAAWHPVEPLWARIEALRPGTMTEQWQGERPHFAARYWVWLRADYTLPAVYRLRWEDRVLIPISAVTQMPGREWQLVLVEEEAIHGQ